MVPSFRMPLLKARMDQATASSRLLIAMVMLLSRRFGTWSFSVSADGYETNNWDQEITETDTKDAFLQKKQSHEFGGVEYPNGITSFADHVVSTIHAMV